MASTTQQKVLRDRAKQFKDGQRPARLKQSDVDNGFITQAEFDAYTESKTTVRKERTHKAKTKTYTAKEWSCDFETEVPEPIYDENGKLDKQNMRTWVWLWGAVAVPEGRVLKEERAHGNTIESFFEWFFAHPNKIFYFHNLKFDGNFIIAHLLKNGFGCDKEHTAPEEAFSLYGRYYFEPVISDMGSWYKITIYRYNDEKEKYDKYVIQDSLKRFASPVASLAKGFETTRPKGECDYEKHRPEGYEPTPEEIDYCLTDCQIIAEVLAKGNEMGITKMTAASSALAMFKEKIGGAEEFDRFFPKLDAFTDSLCRRSYKGGFCWVNPKFQEVHIREKGIVLDVNSMYPGVMLYKELPYGLPHRFEGSFEEQPEEFRLKYPFYFVEVRLTATLKPDGVPFIQGKKGFSFGAQNNTTYSARPKDLTTVLNKVDIELLFQNYEVEHIVYYGGVSFRSKIGLATPYIEEFKTMKETSKGAKRQASKLFLNSIYGKFGANPLQQSKFPELDGNVVKYTLRPSEPDEKNTVFVPYASAVTSQARKILNDAIHAFGLDRFMYCDTDSVHILGTDVPDTVPVHDSRFADWKVEGEFTEAKYLHTKCYIEVNTETGERSQTIAGLPKSARNIGFDEFKAGLTVKGAKLTPVIINGGVLLMPKDFAIRPFGIGTDAYLEVFPNFKKYSTEG